MKSFLRLKKPCYPHGQQSLAKVKFATYYSPLNQYMMFFFVSLHIVFAHVVGRAQLVVHHVLDHHILITELLDDDFIIR